MSASNTIFDVYAYWGTSNGTVVAGNWEHSAYVGAFTNVLSHGVSHGVSNLAGNAYYYYTFMASNAFSSLWAEPSASFTTAEVTIGTPDGSAAEFGPETGTFAVYRPAGMP